MKNGILFTLLTSVVSLSFSGRISAASAARSLDGKSGKVSAPNQDDGVAYFSGKSDGNSQQNGKQAEALRLETIESIKKLLGDKKNSRQEFELMIRLGELHIEQADYLRSLEIEDYVAKYKAWEQRDPSTRGKAPSEASYRESEASLLSATQVFRKLVNRFSGHPRVDAAIYSLAKTLGRLNDENAAQYYRRLVTNHPNSVLVPDTWLALGEFYFDKHQIKEAKAAYLNVMKFKDHKAYAYAVYKLGWCYYNSQGSDEKEFGENLKKSITSFKLVIRLSEKNKLSKFDLRDEALRDLVMVYAEAEDTEAAWSYFQEIGERDKFYSMLERMGALYVESGKNTKAVEVYSRLLKEAPTRKSNPQVYVKLVELYDLTGKFSEVVGSLSQMQTLFVKSSEWTAAFSRDDKVRTDAFNLTELTTRRFGTMFHTRGQKIKNAQLESRAAEIYELYLVNFERHPESYTIRYYLADIQMSQKKFAVAAANYVLVAKSRPVDGRFLKESAFNAVEAMATLVNASKFDPVPPPGQALKTIEIPRLKKVYLDTLDLYTSLLPSEKGSMAMRYSAAQILFDYGHYQEAMPRFDKLATQYGSTRQGISSSRVILGFYNEKAEWSGLIQFGKKFLASKDLMADQQNKKYIEDMLRVGMFKRAQAEENSGEFAKAASSFLDFYKVFPGDSNSDRALYNAGLNQFKSYQVDQSIETRISMLKTFPKSSLAPTVMVELAETYEALARFDLASDMYLRFAKSYPNDKRAPVSIYNAAVLCRGIDQKKQAAEILSDLYRKYPDHSVASEAIFESARLRELSGDVRGSQSDYASFLTRQSNPDSDDALFASAKITMLKLRQDSKSESGRRDLQRIVSKLKSSKNLNAPEARRVIAELLFGEQETGASNFRALNLEVGRNFETQISAKQSRLEKLAKVYEEIISIRNAEFGVASLYRLGELHENFANTLFNAPTPPGLDQKSAAQFKSQLEKAGFPLRDEAYRFYEAAYTQSSNVDTFSHWTEKTYSKMVELAPEKHPRVLDAEVKPSYVSQRVALNDATQVLDR